MTISCVVLHGKELSVLPIHHTETFQALARYHTSDTSFINLVHSQTREELRFSNMITGNLFDHIKKIRTYHTSGSSDYEVHSFKHDAIKIGKKNFESFDSLTLSDGNI